MASPAPLRRSRVAVTTLFLVHGLVFASWAARVPEVAGRLHLSPAVLGPVLAGPGLGALAGSQLGGLLVARFGSRGTSVSAPLLLCAPLALVPWADRAGTLFAVLLVMGAGDGVTSVAMSAQSVAVQTAYGRPVINSMHAVRSLGAVVGSLFGAVSASLSLAVQFGLAAASAAVLSALAAPGLLPGRSAGLPRSAAVAVAGKDRAVLRAVLLLAAMAFLSSLVEDAPASWGGVYLRSAGAGPALAASAYAAFSVGEVIGRLLGDRWVARFGWVRVIRAGTLLCAFALTAALVLGQPWVMLVALVPAGVGISAVFPGAYATAGALPGAPTAIAQVGFAGNAGWLLVGPLIGLLAAPLGLAPALGVLPAAGVALAALAGVTRLAGNSSAAEPGVRELSP